MNSQPVGELVLSERQIQQGVETVARKLNERFVDAVIVSVVPGGILFTADLVRRLGFEVEMDWISCPHTPGDSNNRSAIVFHQNVALEGRDVILVDDAIESGGTMRRLVEHLSVGFGVNSLSTATLLVKPGRVDIPVEQYHAYEMASDDLLVGYGLAWQGKLRNLPYVSKQVAC